MSYQKLLFVALAIFLPTIQAVHADSACLTVTSEEILVANEQAEIALSIRNADFINFGNKIDNRPNVTLTVELISEATTERTHCKGTRCVTREVPVFHERVAFQDGGISRIDGRQRLGTAVSRGRIPLEAGAIFVRMRQICSRPVELEVVPGPPCQFALAIDPFNFYPNVSIRGSLKFSSQPTGRLGLLVNGRFRQFVDASEVTGINYLLPFSEEYRFSVLEEVPIEGESDQGFEYETLCEQTVSATSSPSPATTSFSKSTSTLSPTLSPTLSSPPSPSLR